MFFRKLSLAAGLMSLAGVLLGVAPKECLYCNESQPYRAFEEASLVVLGKVGTVGPDAFEFLVDVTFKGTKRKSFEVKMGPGCRLPVKSGAVALAYFHETNGQFQLDYPCVYRFRLLWDEEALKEAKQYFAAGLANPDIEVPCVPMTDICPPEGSVLKYELYGYPDRMLTTITTSKEWQAWGVDFAPGIVRVLAKPRYDNEYQPSVQIEGTLARPQRVSGLLVKGEVALWRLNEGTRETVALLRGSLVEKGRLELPGFPQVTIEVGSWVNGRFEQNGLNLELDLASVNDVRFVGSKASLRVSEKSQSLLVSGLLFERQKLAGAEFEGNLSVEFSASEGRPRLLEGKLAAAAPLAVFTPLEGVLPAGASFKSPRPNEVTVRANGPIELAGRLVKAPLEVTTEQTNKLGVVSWAMDGGTEVFKGVTLQQRIGWSFTPGQREPTEVGGKLVRPQRVGDVWAKGGVLLAAADGGYMVTSATLGKPFAFEGWMLPTGTELWRSNGHWRFTTPPARPARLLPGSSRPVDFVLEASQEERGFTFTSAKPWRPKGAPFFFEGPVRSFDSCFEGNAPNAVLGLFRMPAKGHLVWCSGSGRVLFASNRGQRCKLQHPGPPLCLKAQNCSKFEKSNRIAPACLMVGRLCADSAYAGNPTDSVEKIELMRDWVAEAPHRGYWLEFCTRDGSEWVFVDLKGEPESCKDKSKLNQWRLMPEYQDSVLSVAGGLGEDTILRVSRQHQSAIKSCFKSWIAVEPDYRGGFAVAFTIDAEGAVSEAKISEISINNVSVESCLLSSIRGWKFPKPARGKPVIVNYRWQYGSECNE